MITFTSYNNYTITGYCTYNIHKLQKIFIRLQKLNTITFFVYKQYLTSSNINDILYTSSKGLARQKQLKRRDGTDRKRRP